MASPIIDGVVGHSSALWRVFRVARLAKLSLIPAPFRWLREVHSSPPVGMEVSCESRWSPLPPMAETTLRVDITFSFPCPLVVLVTVATIVKQCPRRSEVPLY